MILRQLLYLEHKMKIMIKKDLRALLPGFAMFVMAGLGLFVISAFGILSVNGNFAVSALYVFVFLFFAAIVYTALKGADNYRKRLPDSDYNLALEKNGVYGVRGLVLRLCQSFIMEIILLTEYFLLFSVLIFMAEKKLADDSGMLGLFDRVKEKAGISMGFGAVLLLYLELLAFSVLAVSLAFLAFSLCYKFFLRVKYAFMASIMTSLTMFWVIWKLYDFMVPKSGLASLTLSIVYALIVCSILSLIFIWQMKDMGRKETEI